VTLSSGSYSSSATLSGGGATVNVPAGTLAIGTDTLTASYTPDSASSSTYNSAIGTNTVAVTTPPLTAQTIAFANPGAQTVGTPLTLSATATSSLAVSFTSTTASICTVSGTQAAFLAPGICTIDATQAGNSTYAAAAMVAQSFTVNGEAQTITFGTIAAQTVGTPLTLSATATSSLAVTFASTTTSVCTLSGTQATFLTTGTCTIDANQAGNSTYAAATMVPQSFAVNAALAPSFTIASSTGAQTVQPGGAATYTISVTPVNGSFSNTITLTASGLPPGAKASFLPATLTPGSSSATSTLTIQTAAATGTARPPASPWPLAAPALALIGLFIVPSKRRRRWITLGMLLFASLGAVAALSGCGGGFAMGSSPKSYTVTVTGTSGANNQTTTVQLTVE